MKAYIYKIENKANGKFYIGSTKKQDPTRRRDEHFSKLRNNKHPNKPLQNSFNKYSERVFEFVIVEEFLFPEEYSKEYIYEYISLREVYYINYLQPIFNICREITGGKLGRVQSEEERESKRQKLIGRFVSEETKAKIRKARAKQIITEEQKLKISKTLKNTYNLRKKEVVIG
jgi:group I intron endonuclease